MILFSKFNIGDRVWYGNASIELIAAVCPFCAGSGRSVILPAENAEQATPEMTSCPKCRGSKKSYVVESYGFVVSLRQLTVRSVQVGVGSCYKNVREEEFMCEETSTGASGSLYHDHNLFAHREDAELAARAEGLRQLEYERLRQLQEAVQQHGFKCKHCGHRRSDHDTDGAPCYRCSSSEPCPKYEPDYDERAKWATETPAVQIRVEESVS